MPLPRPGRTSPSAGVTAVEPLRGISARTHLSGDPVFWLLGLAIFVVTVMWSGLYVAVTNDYRNTGRQAEVNLSNLARAFAEHTTKTIEGADQAVRFVRAEYLQDGARFNLNDYLRTRDIIDEDYHLLSVIGADGFVVTSSQPFTRVDLREREHFKVHAEGGADRVFLSKPVLGKVSGKWSIQVTRRIDDPLGHFAGVVVVSMPPSYFTRFYGDVDLGPTGLTALVGRDGVVRARATRTGADQGQDIGKGDLFKALREHRNGTARLRSMIDGIERLYAFRTLERYDLYVVTAMGVDDIYQEPRQRARVWALSALVVTLVIGLFTVHVVRRARRQRRLMQELIISQAKAESANRLKSNFLASVSHELRTPLNGILGYAELVRDMSSDEEAREFGGIIHSSAEHLHQLVNTILDLAKIESGHLVTRIASTDLPALLEDVKRLHTVHAQQRCLTLELELAHDCPATLDTDRTRLLQVLTNVVNNAIKFTEQGGITLSAQADRGGVELRVTDTGIGIAQDRIGELFTRFQAVSSNWGISGQGAGLGLPLAKELVERLGGVMGIRSEPDRGTCVTIWLPLSAPAAVPGATNGPVFSV
jgi:signal transduction histidine kinase